MAVDVTRRAGVPRLLTLAEMRALVGRALRAAGAPRGATAGLILSDDAELAGLNATHMGSEGPTDVLSFPLLPVAAFPPHPGQAHTPERGPGKAQTRFALPPGMPAHLGDIVVSVERAIEQAEAGHGGHTGDVRWSPADELRLLITHGTLHLCGWDHADPEEEAVMRALEWELVAQGRGRVVERMQPSAQGSPQMS